MNFKINVKGLREGIQPACIIATVGVTKDNVADDHIAIKATPECLYAIANGGRVSINNPIPYETTFGTTTFCTDYKFQEAGSVTVQASDLLRVLASFSDEEILTVSSTSGDSGSELSFRPTSDPEEVQTLPIHNIPITPIALPAKKGKQITLNRQLFCKGVERIIFAGGFEESRPRYLYWMLRTSKGTVRFTAGSGTRFAILGLSGEPLDGLSKEELLIPVEPTHVLLRVLKQSTSDNVILYQSGTEEGEDPSKRATKHRFVFESGDVKVVVAGFDASTDWINEDEIIGRKNNYRAVVDLKDWSLAMKGVDATNNEEIKDLNKKAQKIHGTTISLNCDKRIGQLNSVGTMKALRKMKIVDMGCAEAATPETSMRCATAHLADIIRYAGTSKRIQFEMVDHMKPAVVRFYAEEFVSKDPLLSDPNEFGVKEEFVQFIGKLKEV